MKNFKVWVITLLLLIACVWAVFFITGCGSDEVTMPIEPEKKFDCYQSCHNFVCTRRCVEVKE